MIVSLIFGDIFISKRLQKTVQNTYTRFAQKKVLKFISFLMVLQPPPQTLKQSIFHGLIVRGNLYPPVLNNSLHN